MPTVKIQHIARQSTNSLTAENTNCNGLNVYRHVKYVTNAPSDMGSLRMAAGSHPPRPDLSDVAGKSASLFINKYTAKEVLAKLVKLPRSENTYSLRLACLKADRSIPTWHALTRDPEQLKALEKSDLPRLESLLTKPGVWLPEVESMHVNVMANLTVKLCALYDASFQSLLLNDASVEGKDVFIVRGAPAAGKTSYLKGGFSLGADEVKEYLLNRMPGVSMPQLHMHSYILLDQFMNVMERKVAQGLTRDSLYLKPEAIENKLKMIALQDSGQKSAIHDIQVDLTTLCCRMLKRSTDEPLMSFDYLSQSFRLSLEKRQETIDLVQNNHDLINEYSLSAWNGSKNVKIAQRSADSQSITIHDQIAFEQLVKRDAVLIANEIERVRDTTINSAFIADFTAGLEPAIASVFTKALNHYDGKTIAEALELHRDREHVATSVASRVLAAVVPV